MSRAEVRRAIAATLHQTRFELRRHLRGVPFVGSTLLLLLLAGLVTWVEVSDHRLRRLQIEEEQRLHRSELASQTVYSYLRPQLFRPVEPLAIFEAGVLPNVGHRLEISAFEIPRRTVGRSQGNSYLTAAAGLDLTTVFKIVLGLQALLLTYDGVSRAPSLLRIDVLLAHGASPGALMAAKLLAAWATLGISLLLTFGGCLGLLVQSHHLRIDGQTLLPLLGLFVAYGIYGAAMASLGLAISVRSSDRGRSLAVGLLVWWTLVLFWPQAWAALAEAWSKNQPDAQGVESRVAAQDTRLDHRVDELWERDPLRTDWSGYRAPYKIDEWDFRILRRFGASRYHESAARHYRQEIQLGAHTALTKDALRRSEDAVHHRASQWVERLSWISPGFLLDRLTAELAGTSADSHDAFLASAREYQRRFLDDLDRRGVLGSHRWFTDDPPEGMPWTLFIGLPPEAVNSDNVVELRDRFRSDEVQAKTVEEIRRRRREETLDLGELPVYHPPRSSFFEPDRRARLAWPVALLLGQWLLLTLACRRPVGDGPRPVRRAEGRSSPGLASRSPLAAELRSLFAEVRWRWLATATVLAVVLACWIGMLEHRAAFGVAQRTDFADARRAKTEPLREFAGRPHTLALPPHPLGVFDGSDRKLGRLYHLSTNPWQRSSPAVDAPSNPRLPESAPFDLAFVLWVLLPLAAFLLTYDALGPRARERIEWLGLWVPRWRLLAMHWGVRTTALALPLVVGLVLGPLLCGWQPLMPWSADSAIKAAALLLLALFSIAFFTLLAFVGSALLGGGGRSLVALVFLWLATVAVLPAVAELVARRMAPQPTRELLEQEAEAIRAHLDGLRSASDWRPTAWAAEDDYSVERRSAAIQSLRVSRQRTLQRTFFDQRLSQAQLARQLAGLSPSALFAGIGQLLSGGGPERHHAFLRQADDFREPLERELRRQNREDPSRPDLGLFPRYLSQRAVERATLPHFRFEELSWQRGLRRALPSLATLLLLLALFWMLLCSLLDRRLRHGALHPRTGRTETR